MQSASAAARWPRARGTYRTPAHSRVPWFPISSLRAETRRAQDGGSKPNIRLGGPGHLHRINFCCGLQSTDQIPPLRHQVCHWGQRKLLLSEVEFFTTFFDPLASALVIYAGAAPGHHIPLLSEMFPRSVPPSMGHPAGFRVGVLLHRVRLVQIVVHALALSPWALRRGG